VRQGSAGARWNRLLSQVRGSGSGLLLGARPQRWEVAAFTLGSLAALATGLLATVLNDRRLLLLIVVAAAVLFAGYAITAYLRPALGLALGLMALYSPTFNYTYLYTHEFSGGHIRAGISALVMAALFLGTLARRRAGGERLLPGSFRLSLGLLALGFVAIGIVNGLANHHSLRLVAGDTYPAVEFCGFLLVTLLSVQTRSDVTTVLRTVLAWGVLVSAIDVVLYFTRGDFFLSHFALNGGKILVHRLDDFMPALFLGICIGLLLWSDGVEFLLLAAATVIVWNAVILTFFRSMWVGDTAAVLVALALVPWRRLRRLGRGLAVTLAAAAVLFVAEGLFLARSSFHGQSLSSVVAGRVGYVEPTSGTARVVDNLHLLTLIVQRPVLGFGLGGSENGLPYSSTSNFYLSSAVALGVPALLLFLWLLGRFLLDLKRQYDRAETADRAFLLAVIGAFVAVGVTLLTFPSLLHHPIPAYLGALSGLALRRRGLAQATVG